jgi:DNA-binding LytR/AlgR family response regulator
MNTHRPTAIIADDEPLLRAQLAETLGALWPELRIVGMAAHGEGAVQLVARERPDIVFLDIEMPGMNGLEAAAQVKGLARIVFVTAYHQYAVDAFEREAVDYVLKPASEARLRETIERLKARVAQPAPQADVMATVIAQVAAALGKREVNRLKWIQASLGNQIRLIPVGEVLFFQSDLKYTRVVTREGESLIRKPLKDLLDELDDEVFWQIHRGTIVNSAAIAHLVREDDRLSIALKDHAERLEISRTFANRFRSM